ncbi:NTP transferase domain-containing protein [Alphaproteobacteria bacterium GH1-50]|uniref:NTP transferase domain-containing protein n=1 Tax=Kangsaoukella pontilimi TaxID=2691042 RepID=A0A7C9II01_9RHOB|nr:glycosyltransferase family protein [Kangsaoukella pontilimi]MXQ09364.1 NTP transferase domain-containing protein [Kangsaoukella pontilimi]
MPETVVVIQARMGSSRLPGKVLKPLSGQPVLTHVVTRVSAAKRVDRVMVATSTEPADDAIEAACDRNGWTCIRGSETDVLSRYGRAARESGADILVRVTSDCPLFSPAILDAMLDRFDPARMDYMSTNWPERTFPVGLDCEVLRADRLIEADDEATDPYDREHVTPFLYRNPKRFRLAGHRLKTDLSDIRITLDTAEDYDRLVTLLAAHPELADPATDVIAVVERYFS